MLLVVDQFEELTEAAPDAGHELLAVLSELAVRGGAAGPLRIVLTVRGLALDTALTPAIADALGSGSVLVGPMDRSRLREVIVRPAERAPGLAFEDGLVDRILDDAGSEPGQLPFVESLLAQLWARREGGTLTHRGYEASGEVAGALAAHAERVVSAVVTEPRSAAALRALCTRLAAPGRDGRFVRKAIRYVDLPPELRELVPVLAAGRLVVVAGGTGSGGTVELAHQALLEHWPRLRDRLDADREFLVWHAALADDQQRWEAAGRDHGALLRGTALAGAEDWARRRGAELSGPELDYIHHSRSRRRRDVRRTRLIGATVGALTLVAGLLTVVAVRGTEQLATQQAQTNAEVLAAQAAATTRLDPLLAAELAQAAWRSDPTDPRARSVLGGQYLALESAEAVLTGGPGGAPISTISAAGIPDSGVVEVVSTEGVTVLSGALQPGAPAVHLPPVVAGQGSVSPDARHYATVSADGAVRLWISVADPATEIQLAGPGPEPVLLAGFAPDSSRVGWLTRTPDGRYALTTYDLLTGTAATATIDLPAPPTEVHLTVAPDRVLVRSGATGTPNDRLAVHSLTGGAETWVAPQGSLTGAAGGAVTSCTAGDIAAGRRTTLAVTDPATGAATRTLPLMVGTTCEFLWLTADGRFALEPSPAATDAHNSTWRATDLSSGRSYQFLTPPVNIGDWPKAKRSPTIAVLPAADGSATAVVAAGPAVLKVRTSPEIPPDDGGMPPPSRVLDPTGRVLVTSGPTGMAAYDAATGQELGRRSDPLTKDVIQFWDDQPWMLDRARAAGCSPATPCRTSPGPRPSPCPPGRARNPGATASGWPSTDRSTARRRPSSPWPAVPSPPGTPPPGNRSARPYSSPRTSRRASGTRPTASSGHVRATRTRRSWALPTDVCSSGTCPRAGCCWISRSR
ncbi:hypothetical protein BJF90_27705 [Pseudonocardia sp. CNS-004]|nr:hypothetical protein BJF90_27705 [Pseudonocardia sp. CNS-004]